MARCLNTKLIMNGKKVVCAVGLVVSATLPQAVNSQNVVIDAEIRPRTEMRDGFKIPNAESKDPGFFTSQRTRLGLTYTSGLLNAQLTLQDARVYGLFANSAPEATTGLFEGWAELVLVPGGTLKVGRQQIKYDDSRLFSAPAWSNSGTTHDLALFKYNLNDWQLHAGMAYNNSSEIASETLYANTVKYRSIAFAWLSKEVFPGMNASALVIDEGLQDTVGVGLAYKKIKMNHALTYGGNLKYQTPGNELKVLGTAYFQSGKNIKGKDMSGSLYALKVDYAPLAFLAFNAGADYFSGDDKATDGMQTNFKKLYGADHTFNGVMDYWDAPLDQGLLDFYGGFSPKISRTLNGDVVYHLFQTDKALSNGGKKLGSELDLILNYKLNAQSMFQAGWCWYFTNDNTLLAKKMAAGTKINSPQWAYVMLTIKTTFFNSTTFVKL